MNFDLPIGIKAPGRQYLANIWEYVVARTTIARWVTSLVLIAFISGSVVLGYSTFKIFEYNKKNDLWAIIFMSLELRAHAIASALVVSSTKTSGTKSRVGEASFRAVGSRLLFQQGENQPKLLDPKDLGLENAEFIAKYNLINFAGQILLVYPLDETSTYRAVPFDADSLFRTEATAQGPGLVYVVTSEGVMLASNSSDVTAVSFPVRGIVQKFINNDFRSGQLEFTTPNGVVMFGAFHEVPESNVILFSETTKSLALAAVFDLRRQYGLMTTLIILILVLVIIIGLQPIIDPVKDMVQVARSFSRGDFNARPAFKGIGETAVLNLAFASMGGDLLQREIAVARLHEKQKENLRLEGELVVAKNIQENFMPHGDADQASQTVIEALYQPATEAAGDWYNYNFDPVSGESVIAIADVSGHGAGSAMFTAIIAGMFEHHRRLTAGSPFPVEKFIRSCSHLILNLGKKKWHATMQVATWTRGNDHIEIFNAGHVSCLVIASAEGTASQAKIISMQSHLVGMEPESLIGFRRVDFQVGARLIMYTDGLVEAKNPEGVQYGHRRLLRSCGSASKPKEIVRNVLSDWKRYLAGTPADDDVCIVAMQRIS